MNVQRSNAEITVFAVRLTSADCELLDLLDARERQRVERAVSESDRARIMLGAVLLRVVAASILDVTPAEVRVDRTCTECGEWHGRPTLPGAGLDMSVSHSGAVVTVAALTGAGRVGVDVERIGDRSMAEVVEWTIAEAQFKAGGGSGLIVHRLPPPEPGHVLTLATDRPAATVQVADATPLLAQRV